MEVGMLYYMIVTSCVIGFIVVPVIALIVSVCRKDTSIKWVKELPSPAWDFTKSWASNITVAGTVLNFATLLSCFSPPANLYFFPKSAYLSLGTIAGGLCILAPLAFNMLSKILNAYAWAPGASFLVCAGITTWGVTLQLLLEACLLQELKIANILPPVITIVFTFPLLVFSVGVLVYAGWTEADVLKQAPPKQGQPPRALVLL
jgi:hypothetical protein